jgi:hypothetical protein
MSDGIVRELAFFLPYGLGLIMGFMVGFSVGRRRSPADKR